MARTVRELTLTGAPQSDLLAPEVYSLDAIRAALPADTTLVEFFTVEDRIILCLVDRDRVEMAPVSLMSRVASQIRMLQFQFSKFRLGADYIKTFERTLLTTTRAHLHEIFKELLAPAWSQLRGRRLVIVPHGALHYVPFHALFDGEQYVTDACACRTRRARASTPAASSRRAVAAAARWCSASPTRRRRSSTPRPGPWPRCCPTRSSASAPTRPSRCCAPSGRDSRIVHIASHGHFRPENPMFSGIRLGDTYLNVYDLYRLRLRADLVTLSGCATGANVAAAGDELLGITRGLFCAGAHTLLLSLWNVHDESTAALMTRLYRRIAAGAAPVDALRDTMRDLRSERPASVLLGTVCPDGQIRAGVNFFHGAPLFPARLPAPIS